VKLKKSVQSVALTVLVVALAFYAGWVTQYQPSEAKIRETQRYIDLQREHLKLIRQHEQLQADLIELLEDFRDLQEAYLELLGEQRGEEL